MTREDKLYSLKGDMLIAECDKLGVKVSCNKSRTQLKESKSKVVDRILAFEANTAEVEKPDTKIERKLVPMPGIEKLEDLKKEFPVHKSAKVFALPDSIKNFANYYDKGNYYKVKVNNKTVAEIYPQRKSICVYVKKEVNTKGYNVVKDDYKYYLPVKISIPYDDVSRLEDLINEC